MSTLRVCLIATINRFITLLGAKISLPHPGKNFKKNAAISNRVGYTLQRILEYLYYQIV